MKNTLIVCFLGFAAAALPAAAGDLIVNPSLTLTAEDVKDVFLGDKQLAGTTKLVAVDNAAEQQGFDSGFLQMDAHKYQALWAKKSFREGLNPPATKSSDAEVVAFVKATPGGVGYVKVAPAGVKVVGKY